MPNGNQRGSTRDRKARKLFLLATYGDGTTAPCHECGDPVTYETMVVDRIVPAVHGGTYSRNNIRVHCRPCSDKSGHTVRTTYGQVLLAGRHYHSAPYRAQATA